MPDLKPRHTPEGLDSVIEAVRRHNSPKRPVWITDLDDLNYIVGIARMVCVQPDKYRIAQLEQAIKEAEQPTVTLLDDAPCGYFPGSASDPRD